MKIKNVEFNMSHTEMAELREKCKEWYLKNKWGHYYSTDSAIKWR